ncbi:hypothetical protein TW95_gp1158 [Pandoravirus inopinatum]|uniref:Transmembrane protein n=1 Tax=Pandoravirus inopinatum TaxID=1605721 RepID=A0A0B5JDS8_9VIRU|nr:hypothetical protein TW95_gp1158 [Pandoravirus inopinatum]AJF97892.1 hypothetical protein [Pandoravirus inopinatum]
MGKNTMAQRLWDESLAPRYVCPDVIVLGRQHVCPSRGSVLSVRRVFLLFSFFSFDAPFFVCTRTRNKATPSFFYFQSFFTFLFYVFIPFSACGSVNRRLKS